MTDDEEKAWEQGNQAAYRSIFQEAARHLPDVRDEAALLSERALAVSILRQVCAEHGDNDWDDDLHLADIIEKHLWRHLESNLSTDQPIAKEPT